MEKTYTINGHAVEIHVDEPNRAVIATIRGCTDDAQDRLFDRCGLSAYFPTTPPTVRESIRMNDSYRCVARCAPEDSFDAETGTRIAVERLQKKYLEKLSVRLNNISEWLNTVGAEFGQQALQTTETAIAVDPLKVLSEPKAEPEVSAVDPAVQPTEDATHGEE